MHYKLMMLMMLLATPPSIAQVQKFELDPVHTQVVFFVSHMGYSNSMGVFRELQGHFSFDPDDWSLASAEVSVKLNSLDFGDEEWNRNSLGGSLLNAEQHPEMRLVADRLERHDEHSGTLHGELTLNGITLPLQLDLRLNRIGSNVLTRRYTAGFSATGMISRSAFGVSGYSSFVGDAVHLRIEAEGLRKRD